MADVESTRQPVMSPEAADGGGAEQQVVEDNPTQSKADRVTEMEEQLLRARADYQNLQRRTTQERFDAIRYANEAIMKSLLDVVDDFDRAMAGMNDPTTTLQAARDGVALIHSKLMKSLTELGLEPIEAAGKAFDPAVHQALMQQPTDKVEPGMVVEELTRGYRLGDRVLRPAMVSVAKPLS